MINKKPCDEQLALQNITFQIKKCFDKTDRSEYVCTHVCVCVFFLFFIRYNNVIRSIEPHGTVLINFIVHDFFIYQSHIRPRKRTSSCVIWYVYKGRDTTTFSYRIRKMLSSIFVDNWHSVLVGLTNNRNNYPPLPLSNSVRIRRPVIIIVYDGGGGGG